MAECMLERRIELKEALPAFMTEYREMDALLDAEAPELEQLRGQMQAALADMFISTASEQAIARYERIASLHAAQEDSLQTRRLRVLLAHAKAKKFTIPALIAAASVLGQQAEVHLTGGHGIGIDFLSGDAGSIAVLEKEFRRSLPAHMEVSLRNVSKVGGGCHAGGAAGLCTSYSFTGV